MSYTFRFESIPSGSKLELLNFNGKRHGEGTNIVDYLTTPLAEDQKVDVVVVKNCVLKHAHMVQLNKLMREHCSRYLWRVHLHRSVIADTNHYELQ
mmetsp:Transcript_12582/g.16164  ORF Transcript_12582/g.16164 Transcript_12582/m.16164 type:complete len:96 (+) Transcript_12582:198-485(+)